MIGKTISHYKILSKLGEGGMGVVYKAEDTKLDRIVALKFLPSHLTANDTDKARFIQEAKAAAAINHPNVCTIFDIQKHDGQQFIVMEYVEGQTLREIVGAHRNVPLPIDDAINYASQIADALKAAHAKDIIHRDIKSENIMVTSTGQVKVMDFGLAKLRGSVKLTKTSTTAGTLSYSSPEQIQGKEADARSDIFSFGVVLYEMLTGRLPFKGDYESALIYSILDEEPEPVQKFIPGVSSELIHIINRILEKDPENRYQSMKDVLIDLKRVKRDTDKMSSQKVMNQKTEFKKTNTISIKKVIFIVIPTLALLLLLNQLKNIFINKSSISKPLIPVPVTSLEGEELSPTFSPDGKQIAFHYIQSDTSDADIYIQLIGTNDYKQMTNHPADDISPTWSPTEPNIAFSRFSQDEEEKGIYLISIMGTGERKICLKAGYNLCFSSDGNYLAFTDDSTRGIFILSMKDYILKRLTTAVVDRYGADWDPVFSPDNLKLAFERTSGWSTSDIYTISVTGENLKRITHDAKNIWGIAYMPNGQDIVFSSNRLGPLSLWKMNIRNGFPEMIHGTGQTSLIDPTVTIDGSRLAYCERSQDVHIYRIRIPEAPGQKVIPSKVSISTQQDRTLAFSPDGKKVAFSSTRSGFAEIWICDSDWSNWRQLTNLRSHAGTPSFSPDGKQIVFDSNAKGNNDIYLINVNGGEPQPITNRKSSEVVPEWSHDGDWIYFISNRGGEEEGQIWKIAAAGGDEILISDEAANRVMVSKDGNWLYYVRSRSGIWKMGIDGSENERLLEKDDLYYHSFAVSENGIYFIDDFPKGGFSINYLNLKTREVIEMVNCDQLGFVEKPKISPDKKWIYYTHWSQRQTDIYMIENFW